MNFLTTGGYHEGNARKRRERQGQYERDGEGATGDAGDEGGPWSDAEGALMLGKLVGGKVQAYDQEEIAVYVLLGLHTGDMVRASPIARARTSMFQEIQRACES